VACTAHRRQAWREQAPPVRVRGRRLQALRATLFRAHPFCVRCLRAVATIRDHVRPLAEGGTDDEQNVQALCQDCSDAKTATEARRGQDRRHP
jgi:5-methylcytosine-specific restriction protein A